MSNLIGGSGVLIFLKGRRKILKINNYSRQRQKCIGEASG